MDLPPSTSMVLFHANDRLLEPPGAVERHAEAPQGVGPLRLGDIPQRGFDQTDQGFRIGYRAGREGALPGNLQ